MTASVEETILSHLDNYFHPLMHPTSCPSTTRRIFLKYTSQQKNSPLMFPSGLKVKCKSPPFLFISAPRICLSVTIAFLYSLAPASIHLHPNSRLMEILNIPWTLHAFSHLQASTHSISSVNNAVSSFALNLCQIQFLWETFHKSWRISSPLACFSKPCVFMSHVLIFIHIHTYK